MSKRAAQSSAASVSSARSESGMSDDFESKRFKEDVIEDQILGDDFDNEDSDHGGDGPSAGAVGAGAQAATNSAVVPAAPAAPLNNIFDLMKNNSGPASYSNGLTEQLTEYNNRLRKIVTPNMDEELLDEFVTGLDEKLPLKLPLQNSFQNWRVLTALMLPRLNSSPNAELITNYYNQMMESYKKMKDSQEEPAKIREKVECELHLRATRFFKSVVTLTTTTELKHLTEIIEERRTLIMFETESLVVQHAIKDSLNLCVNQLYSDHIEIGRKNPMFKFQCCGVVLCRPKEVRKKDQTMIVSELHQANASFLGQMFYNLAIQRLPNINPHLISNTVFFNLVVRQKTAKFGTLDQNKLMMMEGNNLQLAHVSVSDGYWMKGNNGKNILVVVMYVNYFLTAE
jgi:hypothetical protein